MTLFAVPYQRWSRAGGKKLADGVVLIEAVTFTAAERSASMMGPRMAVGSAVEVDVERGPQDVRAWERER